ncbi:hypothetical protein [Streptomyces sp. ME19-01-6]|uniref:hypothetical protein n=1 Tax=Streptomyces sp. ME19-01-6 TaxID=3028686 RepID=UPI0029BEB9A2|nr:hypothetical protein [Streptomyces sp. ME19-01-6]MDX3232486.1 hypothetical protein [Streptomyces sp. ME19-01-6]
MSVRQPTATLERTVTLTREVLFWVLTITRKGSPWPPVRHSLEVSHQVTTPPLEHAAAVASNRFGLTVGTWTRQGNRWNAPARKA